MKKIVLSALAAMSLGSVAANAIDLYEDANGQVFTSAAEGRTLVKDKSLDIFAHADKLKFSGLTYIGGVVNDFDDAQSTTAQMEIRRAYFQLKAYFLEDPKSYYRVTFDMSKDVAGDEKLRAKYAYIYLNEVLPATGVEIGLAHRPWHDYEEHNAWFYRNISKVLIEDKVHGPDLSNSADFGVMFKTRTQYFDADYGIFNGEGYHAYQVAQNGVSFEWRATAHILGVSGKDKQTTKTYWDASFFGQYNQKHKALSDTSGATAIDRGTDDLVFGGLHTVYNQPNFLIAAQYVKSLDTRSDAITTGNTTTTTSSISVQAGSGYSMNAEYRLGAQKKYRLLARYDSWTPETENSADERENKGYIIGAAWEQNRNLQWIANTIVTDNEEGSSKYSNNGIAYMLTAEVRF